MSLLGLLPVTVVVERYTPGGEDSYGNDTGGTWNQVWTGLGRPDELTGVEDRSDRETTMKRVKIYVPADAVVDDADRVSWAGGPFFNIQQVQEVFGRSVLHHKIIRVSEEV